MTIRWAYGVTTVPSRMDDLLPKTLKSLRSGGFGSPRLFADGCTLGDAGEYAGRFGLEVTARNGPVRAWGNWILSAYELYVREPLADRFALFQDDVLCVRNLRQYLEAWFPERGYLNLYTGRENHDHAKSKGVGWHEATLVKCSDPRSILQTGRGALGLVFDRQGLVDLLSSRHSVERPMDTNRGHRNVDGGVVASMNKAGYREYVHNPSLVQHTGEYSTVGLVNESRPRLAMSFPGENFDALDFLENKV